MSAPHDGGARRAELLAPAGDFKTALAAFDAGADAVYCGLAAFSARAYAKNLSPDELGDLMRVAAARGRKVYVAFNTLVPQNRLDEAARTLALLERIGPDALIVQDLGVAALCRANFPSLALHASTQLAAHNLESVVALGELGFKRVVLARELSFADVASITRRCGEVEIECFIHGALCYSVSGLCLYSAMERGRSGNKGECAYCCRSRMACEGGVATHPFSMKDLRLDALAAKLEAAGVASLKIEGRMKSLLYVASAVKHYRQLLDGDTRDPVTDADLETVFSRRTTTLYFDGPRGDVIDELSPGHLGTPCGVAKRVTKDREGRSWLRFHATRALERHDGLQIAPREGGRCEGFGISDMRGAISRKSVFAVPAGADVEVLVPDGVAVSGGETIYCSMSNAVKRRFPEPSFRPSDWPGRDTLAIDSIEVAPEYVVARSASATVKVAGSFAPAKNPERTREAAEKALSHLGGTRFGKCAVARFDDPRGLYVPVSAWNALRRELVAALDAAGDEAPRQTIQPSGSPTAALQNHPGAQPLAPRLVVRTRADIEVELPDGVDEVVMAPGLDGAWPEEIDPARRIAMPVWTPESSFQRLRVAVKRMIRAGCRKWEASSLSTLRLLRSLGVEDITADWTLYAANSRALASLAELGVRRFVASPENSAADAEALAASGYDVEFLERQSTPLFMSLAAPAAMPAPESGVESYKYGDLWITVSRRERRFAVPRGASVRLDFSWGVK